MSDEPDSPPPPPPPPKFKVSTQAIFVPSKESLSNIKLRKVEEKDKDYRTLGEFLGVSPIIKEKPPIPPKSYETGEFLCIICKNEKKKNLISHSCEHKFCEECFKALINDHILKKGRSFVVIRCPWKRCGGFFHYKNTKEYYSKDCENFVLSKLKNLPKEIPKKPDRNFIFKLSDFGYCFNSEKQLVDKETNEKFYYINEKFYNALGNSVVKYIQNELKTQYKFKEYFCDEKKICNIFRTENGYKKLLVIIQGSGLVRCGQWARSVCINDSLKTGTMFEYIEIALKKEYDVIILNPNLTFYRKIEEDPKDKYNWFDPSRLPKRIDEDDYCRVKNNENSKNHTFYVYDNFIKNQKNVEKLYIVAHSAGGFTVMDLIRQRREILKKLVCCGFTDSFHSIKISDEDDVRDFIRNKSINWVKSRKPLDELVKEKTRIGGKSLSAGHIKHEYTSPSCMNSVFKYFESF